MNSQNAISHDVDTLPDQVIVMDDTDFGKRHPDKAFYLRVKSDPNTIDQINLDGAQSVVAARAIAKNLGHDVEHWIAVSTSVLHRFY
ncbi:hypothetical protein ACI2KR_27025 [Pseudomonas luteola]